MKSLKRRVVILAVTTAFMAGVVGLGAGPAIAEPLVSAYDVSAGINAPDEGAASFPVTGTITNTGAFDQPAGSKLTISANGGSVTAASAGCVVGGGLAVCTAGALSPDDMQSWTATVTTSPNAASVTSKAVASAAAGELNLTPDTANNTATDVTNILYGVETAISSNPNVVRNGEDTRLTASVTNTLAPQNVTLSVELGGTFDPALALAAGCEPNAAGTFVNCTHLYGPGQTREFDMAVKSPATGSSFTSTGTAIGAAGGSDSASVVTGLSPDAKAYVPNGGQLASVHSKLKQTFYVVFGSAPYGLGSLELNQVTLPPGTLCSGVPCQPEAAQALFPNSGKYAGSDPKHPYEWDMNFGKLTCNGVGAPKCSDVVHHILSGTTTVIKTQKCKSFGLATAELRSLYEVCLQRLTKNGDGTWTFRLALLQDIEIPLIGGSTGNK